MIQTSISLSLGLIAPRSLSFSEVTSRSFRTSWEIDANDVQSYLLQYRPEADTNGDYVSVSVPGESLSTPLLHLTPLTKYEVNVYAQYEKGDSFPMTGFETTLEGEQCFHFYCFKRNPKAILANKCHTNSEL